MALLKISRSDEYANRFRNIRLYLDGIQLGVIKNGETKEFEIAHGNHFIKAKIDWCSSNTVSFHINEYETKLLSLNSFAKENPLGIFASIWYISFGANRYLSLKEIPGV